MKTKILKILSLIFTIFMISSGLSLPATASSAHFQDLVIVKYGLTPGATGFEASQTRNDGLHINNLPVDNLGNQLSPVSNIHYLVQKVAPSDASSGISLDRPASYQKLGPVKEMVTQSNGQAELQLGDGFYLISEQANAAQKLLVPALPILIRLPEENKANGNLLSQVYIYPKSSVDTEGTSPSPPSSSDSLGSSGEQTTLPSSSGSSSDKPSPPSLIGLLPDTGEARSLFMAFGLALLTVLIFVLVLSKGKARDQSE